MAAAGTPKPRTIHVVPDSTEPRAFHVSVKERGGESRHKVTLSSEDATRFSAGDPQLSRVIEAAMTFLLDREPKEAILGAFDIGVIRRYFPEFDGAFPDYLARLADPERNG